jgi:hypothetical protein
LLLAHALQRAQQSAESQHGAFAAFTAPAKPSAITAVNTNAFSFFMDFSPLKNQMGWLCWLTAMPSAETDAKLEAGFLDA